MKYIINGQKVETVGGMITLVCNYGTRIIERRVYVSQAEMIMNSMIRDGAQVSVR
jgi:hypothetical protein